MNRAERRRCERDAARQLRRPPVDDWPARNEWIVFTTPGCDLPEHREEVLGAGIALEMRGGVPWLEPTLMDCGCVLELRRFSDLEYVGDDVAVLRRIDNGEEREAS